ncbi:hypothetical protein VKT23_017416 [Stygiomarasmius scandens]|uniref:DUF6534 domain-containing protein n=1 Tax=Marasmiellus scandens TaxID=2682957 RepID=A0ABR1IV89_9AGAR
MTGPNLNMHNSMGCTLIGTFVASFLLGIAWLQSWYYFHHYQKDPWYLRAMVAAAMVFDTIHQGLICHTVYTYLVSHYGEPDFLSTCVWSLLFNASSCLVSGTVRRFFYRSPIPASSAAKSWGVHRADFWTCPSVDVVSKNIYLTAVVSLLVIAEFVCVVAFAIIGYSFINFTFPITVCVVAFAIIGLIRIRTFAELEGLKALSIAVNALAAAGDVLLAASLIYLLRRSKTGFKRSDTMIGKLIFFTFNTGALTTLFAIASLVAIVAAPNTFIYIFFFFNIGRLYTNSFLATLNARQSIRNAGDNVSTSNDIPFDKLGKNNAFGSVQFSNQYRRPDISIKIDTTKELVTDGSVHGSASDNTPTSPIKTKGDMDGVSDIDDRSQYDGYDTEVQKPTGRYVVEQLRQPNSVPRARLGLGLSRGDVATVPTLTYN